MVCDLKQQMFLNNTQIFPSAVAHRETPGEKGTVPTDTGRPGRRTTKR